MSTITTRASKGSPLEWAEVDANFTNLNTDKYQEGSAIGGTTPAAGTFTTLTATGQTSLGGAAGSEGLRVTPLTSSTTYINARAGVNGGNAQFGLVGTGNTDFIQYTLGTGAFRFLTNGVGSDQMRITHTASAVNYVQVTGAATTSAPTISAQGSDTNAALRLSGKGTGTVDLASNGNPYVLQVQGVASGANYNSWRVTGGAGGSGASSVPVLSTWGIDTNVSMALQTKGTGAIDLAAGSSGVNISNGGTVTAITRTATGNGSYTSKPNVVISAPTTAGGVQATATLDTMGVLSATVQSGGAGYTVGDSLSVVGGTGGPQIFTVATVSGGVVTSVTNVSFASYSVTPTNPVSTTGGTGSGCTLNLGFNINNAFTITNAGSGYVEQPTVTFSGGGGSGAAAYATVGSGTTIKSLATTMSLSASAGEVLRLSDNGGTSANYLVGLSGVSGVQPQLRSTGETNVNLLLGSNGTGAIRFTTLGGAAVEQFRVAHTASAVNYVQVTGAATGGRALVTSQGSDATVPLGLYAKGGTAIYFSGNAGGVTAFQINHTTSGVNWLMAAPAIAGSSPSFTSTGSDTNIDLTLTPKGTGCIQFGTYTAGVLTPTGYVEIKDSGGTVRRLLVG